MNFYMERKRQYNLRSAKNESTQVPVEIQLCNDRKFLESSLNPAETVNQDSDQNYSTSELSELDMSDSSEEKEEILDPEKVHGSGGSSQHAGASSSADCNAQMLINQEIYSQLHQISKRLDKVEDGTKKTPKT